MRYRNSQEFIDDTNKRILLIGLSGVGKTTASELLAKSGWQQYSIDWYIGTKFLSDEIEKLYEDRQNDTRFIEQSLKKKALDPVTKKPKVSKRNLYPISAYVGMVGHEELGGLSEDEFRDRLLKHEQAEIKATLDMVQSSGKSPGNFIADASGSLCEIVNPDMPNDPVIQAIDENVTVIYIASNQSHDNLLVERQAVDPKPLYYRQEFLDKYLPKFVAENNLDHINKAEPGMVGSWMLPRLIAERRLRYSEIIGRIGYQVSMDDMHRVSTEKDFIKLIAKTIDADN